MARLVLLPAEDAQRSAAAAATEIQAGHFREAISSLGAAVREYPNDPELWNLLGIASAEAAQTQAAAEAFEKGLRLKSDSISLNENAGLLFYRQEDYARSKRYLLRAAELGSKNPAALLSLAGAELRTGEPARALAQLNELEPQLNTVPAYWDEKGHAELTSSPVKAEASFAHALQLHPNDLAALNGAATAAERQGRDEKALAYLLKARAVAPDDILTLTHFGSVCIRRDLGPDAVNALERARKLDPANNPALFLLARANITVENWQRAYDLFAEFSKRLPNYAPAYYAMGWVAIRLDHIDDARQNITRSLELEPGLVDARSDLAELELKLGNLDKAEKLLSEVLEKDRRHARANCDLADILIRRGDLEAAQAHLGMALQEAPNLASAHYKLATVLFRKHEREKAEQERLTAVNLEAEAKKASRTQLRLILPETEQ